MANNKVVLGNETLIDLTEDTVSANNLLAGATAHDASGNQVTGNVTVPTALADLTDDTTHRVVTDTEKTTWNAKAEIDDTTTSTEKVWSSNKTNTELSAKANSADVPTKAQITNPNLFDNPWFTINQRGQSSYTPTHTDTFTVDRWKIENNVSGLSVTVNNDESITLNNASSGSMYFSIANLLKDFVLDAGTKYTASINVVSYTGVTTVFAGLMNESPWTSWGELQISKTGINTIPCEVPTSYGGSVPTFRPLCFVLNAGATLTIKSVKLELGSVSTLAMDTAPNYATELAKCQRYYQRLENKGNDTFVGIAYSSTANYVRTKIPYTVSMRTTPSLILTGKMCVWGLNYGIDLTSISGGWYQNDNNGLSLSIGNTTGTTVGSFYYCMLPTNSVLELTADL